MSRLIHTCGFGRCQRTLEIIAATRIGNRRWRSSQAVSLADLEPKPTSAIPGPRRWPILACLPYIRNHKDMDNERVYKLWESCIREFGPTFRLDMPGQPPVVYISEPADVQHLFSITAKDPQKPAFGTLKTIRDSYEESKAGQSGILAEQGEHWWRVRRRVQVHTAKPKNVATYLSQMDQVTLDFIDRWAALRDDKNELPHDFTEELYAWALESLGLVTFNRRLGFVEGKTDALKVIQYAKDIFHLVQVLELSSVHWWRWFNTPLLQKLKVAHDGILEYAEEAVARALTRLEQRDPESEEDLNVVEKLLLDSSLSLQDVTFYLVDLLVAGIDTTSMTVAFSLLHLAKNPDQQARLQNELDTVLGDGRQSLTSDQLAQLRFTKACVKETLRINSPSVLTMRTLLQDAVLGGYLVPKETSVHVVFRAAGQRDDYFPRSSEYLPERWLRNNPMGQPHHFASVPFGAGIRNCVGRRFSEQETYTLLSRLLHRYRVEWHYGDVDPKMNVVLCPDKPLRLTMIERD